MFNKRNICAEFLLIVLAIALLLPSDLMSQGSVKKNDLDERVRTFLKKREGTWRDLNVPASDGKILYDVIIDEPVKSHAAILTV